MSVVALSEKEAIIVKEYARINKIEEATLLRRGIDSVVTSALIEQIRLDFEAGVVGSDVTDLFESHDYERLIMQAKTKNIIPDSVIEHLKARAVKNA